MDLMVFSSIRSLSSTSSSSSIIPQIESVKSAMVTRPWVTCLMRVLISILATCLAPCLSIKCIMVVCFNEELHRSRADGQAVLSSSCDYHISGPALPLMHSIIKARQTIIISRAKSRFFMRIILGCLIVVAVGIACTFVVLP